MAKCKRCGSSLMLAKKIKLSDGVLCTSCSKALGIKDGADMSAHKYEEIINYIRGQQKPDQATTNSQPEVKAQAKKPKSEYFFLVHDLDEQFIEKFRKENTDKEDKWEGMSFNDIRENCDEDDKIYEYPEMDLYLEFKEATINDNPALEVYLDDHMVGYVPKTKVKKTKQLLADGNNWKAELYGGKYQYLKGTYVDEWFDDVKIRVTFTL